MSRDSFKGVPQAVWDDLEYEIFRAELEYDDNWRAWRLADGKYKTEYLRAEARGCCGSFETTVTVDGIKWIVGCNYGH